MIRITSKIQPFHPFTFSDTSRKFHQNPSISFSATLYTNTSGSLDQDDADSDPDHSQNLITCSSHHLGHLLKMSSQSIHNFLRYLSLKTRNTVFIAINAPSLLIAPSLPLQNSYFGVLHPCQQPTPLRFRDSEKWCILVLPKRKSLTRNKENKNKTWQYWSQTH